MKNVLDQIGSGLFKARWGSVVFNRILKISPDEFVKEGIARLDPNPKGPCPVALHTACGVSVGAVFDGVRHKSAPSELCRALFRKLRPGGRG